MMFTRWLALLDSVKKARAKPGNKKPEKDKVKINGLSNRTGQAEKH